MSLFRDLITDRPTSKVSHIKLWSNIGMIAMTIAFLWMAYYGTLGWELFLVYAICVTQPVLLSKYIDLRFGNTPNLPHGPGEK